jgi:L-threonylcarbamoyladenylate synthase
MNSYEWRSAPPGEYAVIGDPVEHSLSPRMQGAAFRDLGLSDRYVAVRVPIDEVGPALDRLQSIGYRGLNVTVPLKEAVLEHLLDVDPFAVRAQAVNTVRLPERAGINTDGPGFVDILADLGIHKPARVLLLGAGGSARAIALALADAGYELLIHNRTRERAHRMVETLGISAKVLDVPDPAGASLVVNATSASLQGHAVPLLWEALDPSAVAVDLMYGKGDLPFLSEASSRGHTVVDGLALLVAQGVRAFEWWTGRTPSRSAMRLAVGLTDASAVRRAAEALRRGELVVMPTETVYGLAGNALDRQAVRRIFEAKGRPPTHPLIVHVASAREVLRVASEFPPEAQRLADRFWPGPLTLVLPKRPEIPDEVTAGLPTVAVRAPDHPLALALLEASGLPLAAPSANPFTSLSPTRVDHLAPEILEAAKEVLDGGACGVGVESTVIDCTSWPPQILRPGGTSRAELEEAIGEPLRDAVATEGPQRSPGAHRKHYSPKTPLEVVDRPLAETEGGLTFGPVRNSHQLHMPADPDDYARVLYDALHTLDRWGLDAALVERPPEDPAWETVLDRLQRAQSR